MQSSCNCNTVYHSQWNHRYKLVPCQLISASKQFGYLNWKVTGEGSRGLVKGRADNSRPKVGSGPPRLPGGVNHSAGTRSRAPALPAARGSPPPGALGDPSRLLRDTPAPCVSPAPPTSSGLSVYKDGSATAQEKAGVPVYCWRQAQVGRHTAVRGTNGWMSGWRGHRGRGGWAGWLGRRLGGRAGRQADGFRPRNPFQSREGQSHA